MERAAATFGIHPTQMTVSNQDMTEDDRRLYTSGRLELVPDGIYTLLGRKIPKALCQGFEQLAGIERVVGLAFPLESVPYGGVIIFVRKGVAIQGAQELETLVNHAAAVIKRLHAEQALQESTERLQALVNASPDLIFVMNAFTLEDMEIVREVAAPLAVAIHQAQLHHELERKNAELERAVQAKDEDGRYLEVLTASHDLLYRDTETVKGRLVREILPKLHADLMIDAIRRTVEMGKSQTVEYSLAVPAGERWFEARTAPMNLEVGGRKTVVSTVRDITERKRAEAALHHSHHLLQRTFSNLLETVFVLDEKAQVVDCNQAAASMFGYSREEMLGQTTDFLHVDSATLSEFRQHLYRAMSEKGFLSSLEFRMKRKSGEVFATEHSVMPLDDTQGKRIGWVSVVRDITERKRAEETLRRYNKRLLTLRQIDEAIIKAQKPEEIAQVALSHLYQLVPSFQASVTLIDPVANTSNVLVWTRHGQIQTTAGDVIPLHHHKYLDELRRGEAVASANLAVRPELSDVEKLLLSEGVISYLSVPLMNEGNLIGMINLRSDKPEEMIQNVSHELRTPLTHIIGYGEILGDGVLGDLNKDQAHATRVITDRARALSRLVNMLLSLQRMVPENLDLQPVALEVLAHDALVHWQEHAREKRLTLHLQVAPDLPAVCGDSSTLQQVLDLLLDNAAKFTPTGGAITIQAETHEREVWLSVADTGIGISPDKLDRIFDRFYQVDGSSTRRYGGAGIGLSLAREIISSHGGRIWAESEGIEGHGTTFRIALPISSSQ